MSTRPNWFRFALSFFVLITISAICLNTYSQELVNRTDSKADAALSAAGQSGEKPIEEEFSRTRPARRCSISALMD